MNQVKARALKILIGLFLITGVYVLVSWCFANWMATKGFDRHVWRILLLSPAILIIIVPLILFEDQIEVFSKPEETGPAIVNPVVSQVLDKRFMAFENAVGKLLTRSASFVFIFAGVGLLCVIAYLGISSVPLLVWQIAAGIVIGGVILKVIF